MGRGRAAQDGRCARARVAAQALVNAAHEPDVRAGDDRGRQGLERLPDPTGILTRRQRELVDALTGERDVVVNLDQTNVHLLLGRPNESEDVRNLYELLKVATRTVDGWPI